MKIGCSGLNETSVVMTEETRFDPGTFRQFDPPQITRYVPNSFSCTLAEGYSVLNENIRCSCAYGLWLAGFE